MSLLAQSDGKPLCMGQNMSTIIITVVKTVLYSSLLSPVSCLQIEILRGSIVPQLPALVYHGEGDCEWELIIKASGNTLVTGSNGQRLPLENGIPADLQATCIVNDTVLLNVIISTTGKVLENVTEAITVPLTPQTQFQLQRMLLWTLMAGYCSGTTYSSPLTYLHTLSWFMTTTLPTWFIYMTEMMWGQACLWIFQWGGTI